MEAKKALRRQMRAVKATLSDEEKISKSKLIFEYIEKQPWFIDAGIVMCYWSLPDEVITHEFCKKWMNKKIMLLPRMVGPDIIPVVFDGNLIKEPILGVEEPQGLEYRQTDMINVIIVPGVAFDSFGNRMGRGKGYYDKFLRKTKALKVGVCFAEQVAAEIPTDHHDLPMDLVISF
ncbi:MAG: 5-formyltetrahydrofolate cyclo-ligase [Bacteroidetes bacterium GWF2_43_63]|nr:MAG: 5-formyltetrahydrofolate cyclo-ligase [Bacteroidetes bacterium GWE2_42_42]OFY56329.1 MAG: 5-formyltetrahydrofolate cyclo-ligase [Bacteroidetes bacterium GWF2_43_63]